MYASSQSHASRRAPVMPRIRARAQATSNIHERAERSSRCGPRAVPRALDRLASSGTLPVRAMTPSSQRTEAPEKPVRFNPAESPRRGHACYARALHAPGRPSGRHEEDSMERQQRIARVAAAAVVIALVASLVSDFVTASARAASAPPAPPAATKRSVEHRYFGTTVRADYQWMEDWRDPSLKPWVAAQNAYTRGVLDKLPSRTAIRDRVAELSRSNAPNYTALEYRGGTLFALKDQPPKNQPMLVALASVDDLSRERVIVNPHRMDPTGAVTIDFLVPSLDGSKVAVSLSKGGTESGDVHVFEVATGREQPDVLPRVNGGTAGGSVAWTTDGSGLLYTRYPAAGERPAGDLDFYQQAWFHKLGTPRSDDTYLLGRELPKIAEIAFESSDDGRYVCILVRNGDGGEIGWWLRGPDGALKAVAGCKKRGGGGGVRCRGAVPALARAHRKRRGAPRAARRARARARPFHRARQRNRDRRHPRGRHPALRRGHRGRPERDARVRARRQAARQDAASARELGRRLRALRGRAVPRSERELHRAGALAPVRPGREHDCADGARAQVPRRLLGRGSEARIRHVPRWHACSRGHAGEEGRGARRQGTAPPLRLRRLRHQHEAQFRGPPHALDRAGRHLRGGAHPRRPRVRRRMARGGQAPGQAERVRRLRRLRAGARGPALHVDRSPGHHGWEQWRPADGRRAHAAPEPPPRRGVAGRRLRHAAIGAEPERALQHDRVRHGARFGPVPGAPRLLPVPPRARRHEVSLDVAPHRGQRPARRPKQLVQVRGPAPGQRDHAPRAAPHEHDDRPRGHSAQCAKRGVRRHLLVHLLGAGRVDVGR